ncbi:hypothetical protein CAOG_04893 [Capsaspora owczarzaki ATCC 30864]|uniref:Uncharacterized protein n=1 Tax=Capsaspora owczarzaki (strain ATCC 30864) TaxID=595528 RepID=A0A0D2WQZ2_CAPO3|nr:hypothetical protein CAOG_04893 [Capsaspora owczarzaki ATCC 30864]KJE94215.1 hypothetical protein CAOG_004893 [Capsaspora owczarzaki ATCC 30864]|eukprot:XP_004347644.1 hypothetical protein CAOG_04893 [Capsaspora owczarzaki ATCC 30864]
MICRSISVTALVAFAAIVAATASSSSSSSLVSAARPPSGLYGLSPAPALVRVDPKTGNVTNVGPTIAFELIAQQLATIDPINAIFYFIGLNVTSQRNTIVGLDMNTGRVVVETPLPFILGTFVGVGEVLDFDPETRKLIAMGREASQGNAHHILTIDPLTGQRQDIARIGGIDVIERISGFDQSAGIEWVSLAVNKSGSVEVDLFAFNVRSGQLVHQIPDKLNVDSMVFDQATGKMACLAYAGNSRVLVNLNSRDASFQTVGTVPSYLVMDSSISAFDFKTRVLYAIFQQSAGSHAGNFFLVGVNSETAAVVSSVELCQEDLSDCPLSLEYLP